MTQLVESVSEIESGRIFMTNFEGTLGEFEGVDNGWTKIHEVFDVPDWPLYRKHMDDLGDLNHARHAAHDTLLIKRMTEGKDYFWEDGNFAPAFQEFESEWFEESHIEEEVGDIPDTVTDEDFYREHAVKVLLEKMELYDEDGIDHMFSEARHQGYEPLVISAIPASIASEIMSDYDVSVLKWKEMCFDETGSFEEVWVNDNYAQGKEEAVMEAKESDVEVVFLGDGTNDVRALRKAGTGMYFGSEEDVSDDVYVLPVTDGGLPERGVYTDEVIPLLSQQNTDVGDNEVVKD